jgi:hypothetical protein
MSSFAPGAVFLLLFVTIALVLHSRSGRADPNEELLRRMTPAMGDDDSADLSITRQSRPGRGGLLKGLYHTQPGQCSRKTSCRRAFISHLQK